MTSPPVDALFAALVKREPDLTVNGVKGHYTMSTLDTNFTRGLLTDPSMPHSLRPR